MAAPVKDHDQQLKILVLGESTVGKSCLLLRYVDNTFSGDFMATVGIDFKFKTVLNKDQLIKLQIWDTAGQERFKSITYGFFRGSHGILLVFDVTSMLSFTKVQNWLSDIQKHAGANIPVVLVGNKTDLAERREVLPETAEMFSQQHNLPYVECSAKTGTGVDKAFMTLVNKILETKPRSGTVGSGKVDLQPSPNKGSSGCPC